MKEFKQKLNENSLSRTALTPAPAKDVQRTFKHGGITFIGNFTNDGYGKGKKILPSGQAYEGDFVNWQLHGIGKITYKDGNIYEGECKYGLPQGTGKKTYYDGNIYEGEFVKDFMHGKGKVTYTDGSVYQGNFIHGRPEFSYSTEEMIETVVEKYSEDIKEEDMNAEINLDGSLKPEGFTIPKLTEIQIQAHAKDLTAITKSIWKNRETQTIKDGDLMQTFN